MPIPIPVLDTITSIGTKILDVLFPDPTEKARAQLALLQAEQEGKLNELKVGLSAILAEAESPDKWTSRARPSFMYLFYVVILSLVIVAPVIGIFFPAQMTLFFANVSLGFAAIPEPLWWTFTTGYLGYTAARQYGKKQGTDR